MELKRDDSTRMLGIWRLLLVPHIFLTCPLAQELGVSAAAVSPQLFTGDSGHMVGAPSTDNLVGGGPAELMQK